MRHEERRHYTNHCWCGFVGKDRNDLDEHIANSSDSDDIYNTKGQK